MYEFSILDLFPYIVMLVFMLALIKGKGAVNRKLWLFFLMLFIFSSVRYGIGWDYYGYMNAALHDVDDVRLEHNEPLSRVIIEIAYHTHYQVFFVLSSFIVLFPIYWASKKISIDPLFSLAIYFLFPIYFLESLSIVRNAMAYSVVLLAYVLLDKNKYLLSVVFMVAAILLHKSAAIAILIYGVYFFANAKNAVLNKWIFLILFVSSFFISSFVMSLVGDYSSVLPLLMNIENYAEKGRDGGGIMTYIINTIFIINFVFWDKLIRFNSKNSVLLGLISIGIFFWNIFLKVDSTLSLRFSSFFIIFIIFIVPQYRYVVSRRYMLLIKNISLYFFMVLFLSYFYINIQGYLSNKERMSNLPYQTIFYHTDYTNYVY